MSTWYAQENNGNFSGSSQWNSSADGSGSFGSPIGYDTCDLNGLTVDVDSGAPTAAQLAIVDGSGGNGLLNFSASLTLTAEWDCYCNVQVEAEEITGEGGLQVASTLGLYYVSSTCGSLVIVNSGALLLAWNGQAGEIYCNSSSYPLTINVGGALRLVYGSLSPALASLTGSSPIVVNNGTLYTATALDEWSYTCGPGASVSVQDSYGYTVAISGPSITFPAVGNVMYDVDRGDGNLGTHTDPNTDGHTANAALVLNTAHFGAGNATAGTLDMSTYTLISGVVGAGYVLTGHNNYSGGSAGTLTLPGVGYVSTAAGNWGVAGDGSTGTLDMSTYTLISGVVGAGYVLTGHNNYSGGSAGTLTLPAVADVLASFGWGAAGDGSTGTLTLPGVGYVSTAAGNWGVGGDGSTGTLDMSTYTLISGVVGAGYVLTGQDNYSGGSAGTLTLPGVGYVSTAAGNWGVAGDGSTGTLDMATYQLKTASVLLSAISAAVVENGQTINATSGDASIIGTYAVGLDGVYPSIDYVHADAGSYGPTGVEYTPSLSALANWTLIAGVVSPSNVLLGIPVYVGGPNGTYSGYNTGGLTPADVAAVVATYQAATNSGTNTMLAPVLPNGDISLVAGNDYNANLGNLLDIDASQWPDLTGATVSLQFEIASTGAPDGLPIAGNIVGAGTDDQSVEFGLPHAFTVALQAGIGGAGYHNHTYTITATWTASKNTVSPPRGNASVYVP